MNNEILVLALVLVIPAALMWAIFLVRSGATGRGPRYTLGIPRAMRPGTPDDVLEARRLERVQWGWVASLAALAIFVPAYWLPETSRQESFVERFDEESLHRGELVFSIPKQLPEGISAVAFKEQEEAIALAMGCANCHGAEGAGGLAMGGYKDPLTGKIINYRAPPLDNVFQRWDEEVVRFTIERGRPGTPMPTWGVDFGGPMTPQMVSDVIAYLKSLPGNQEPPEISETCEDPSESQYMSCGQEIFEARCAVCHGPEGQGKEAEGFTVEELSEMTGPGGLEPDEVTLTVIQAEYPEVAERVGTWYPGMALWQGDVSHLEEDQHFATITNGRRFAFMPPWGETPAQGIPVPRYPLLDSQIRAVMAYERSL